MYALQMQNITKSFGNVQALKNISFSVAPAEIHALCGENGAGKSTLMKILSGVYPYGSYGGNIIWNGQEVRFKNLSQSEHAGIAIIAQELALVPEMTIAENIFLGREICNKGIIQWDKTIAAATALMQSLSVSLNVQTKIKDCGVGIQQMVEIAKALSKKAKLLILDEPTAALTETESENLLQILKKLRVQGLTAIIISHKLNEVLHVAQSITVLRDGESVGTYNASSIDEEALIKSMVGRQLSDLYNKQLRKPGKQILQISNLHTWHPKTNKPIIKNVSLTVHSNQIVGIAGLMGAGRTELVETIFGAWAGKCDGQITLNELKHFPKNPRQAIKNGLALVSEDRKRFGLILQQSISANTTLAALKTFSKNFLIQNKAIQQATTQSVAQLKIKIHNAKQPVAHLSGGNQQKVVLAKWLLTKPSLLILDEPTRGIDIGAKAEIYTIIQNLAATGVGILMVSSELPELMGLCDTIYVMNNGTINGSFETPYSAESIMHYATAQH
ncbi:MAG: ATP-binding cassette domain-containing protein [Bacteroidia bacterium]|nr:ATP-binding cassette domain-containing protein [Bacteroidia bacterium]